jgi:hypothetical protein
MLKAEGQAVLDRSMRSVTECVRNSGDEIAMFDDLQPTTLGRYTNTGLLKILQAHLTTS